MIFENGWLGFKSTGERTMYIGRKNSSLLYPLTRLPAYPLTRLPAYPPYNNAASAGRC